MPEASRRSGNNKHPRRSPPRLAEQPDLFAPRAPGWIAKHWPSYVGAAADRRSPLEQWASTIEGLPVGSRLLLEMLCASASVEGQARGSIHDLARIMGVAKATTLRRLDILLAAGLVMLRPWKTMTQGRRAIHLGYEFRVIIDDCWRAKAQAAGFRASRKPEARLTAGAR